MNQHRSLESPDNSSFFICWFFKNLDWIHELIRTVYYCTIRITRVGYFLRYSTTRVAYHYCTVLYTVRLPLLHCLHVLYCKYTVEKNMVQYSTWTGVTVYCTVQYNVLVYMLCYFISRKTVFLGVSCIFGIYGYKYKYVHIVL